MLFGIGTITLVFPQTHGEEGGVLVPPDGGAGGVTGGGFSVSVIVTGALLQFHTFTLSHI
jgi:hypothetical protein